MTTEIKVEEKKIRQHYVISIQWLSCPAPNTVNLRSFPIIYIPFAYFANKRAIGTEAISRRLITLYLCARECALGRMYTHDATVTVVVQQPRDRFPLPARVRGKSAIMMPKKGGKIGRKGEAKMRASRARARRIAQITHETILMKPARHKGLQIQSPRKREMTRRRAFVITTNLRA